MYMNIEMVTDADFENMWDNSVSHMASGTFPYKITQDEEGVYWAEAIVQKPFKEVIKEFMQLAPCVVFRENKDAIAHIALSGEKVGNIWKNRLFMAGPKEGSSSMAWIYTEIALVSYARHTEVAEHTGIYGMDLITSSEESSLNYFVTQWGAKRVGTTSDGGPKWQIRWLTEREDIVPYDLRP